MRRILAAVAATGLLITGCADQTPVVASAPGRDLDTAVREDLGMDGIAEWEAYGHRVRNTLGGYLDAGARPGELRVTDDGTVRGPTRAPHQSTVAADTPPAAGNDRHDNQMWQCSTGLPVTISRAGTAAAVWLTAAHCLPGHGVAGSPTPPVWSSIFNGPADHPHAAVPPGHDDDTADYAADFAVTTRMGSGAVPAHYDAAIPPVRGMKVCSDTMHGWRCGEIVDQPAPGVVRATTYATPGDSGSVAGVGGAAVYVLSWTDNTLPNSGGAAMGYAVTHIRDVAAANGWDMAVGWA